MTSITNDLEIELGPGTSSLQIRIGLHSGAVTAGVLRGDRARFQLFGDTVNTASRMESTGSPNRIQVSQKTAEKLMEAGKGEWLAKRLDPVQAKGKGTMETYWVEPVMGASTHRSGVSSVLSINKDDSEEHDAIDTLLAETETPAWAMTERLIEFNSKIVEDLVLKVLAQRKALGIDIEADRDAQTWTNGSKNVRQEVVDTITLPPFQKATSPVSPSSLELEPQVLNQIREFVSEIARTYRSNAFHSFEHASRK